MTSQVQALLKQFNNANWNIQSRQRHPDIVNRQSTRKPTAKQLKYAWWYYKTGDQLHAYKKAGYAHEKQTDNMLRKSVYNIHNSHGVQVILQAVLEETLSSMGISAKKLIEMAMDAYNNAENVKEQIAAIKLITSIVPVTFKDKTIEIS